MGSATWESAIEETAASIRAALHFGLEERGQTPTWTEALRLFIARADEAGVLVMVSGVVGSNNRYKLDPEEFRGFALCDSIQFQRRELVAVPGLQLGSYPTMPADQFALE